MSVFGVLTLEELVQENDKTRLDATLSYKAQGVSAYDTVEIEPHTGNGFIDVTGDLTAVDPEKKWYLDWQYSSDGTKTVTLKITLADASVHTFTQNLEVISSADDLLFSNDQMLKVVETDIMEWLPAGKSSFKYAHREAQKRIMAYLDEQGFTDTNGNKLTKESVIDVSEVQEWSKYLTLHLIYVSVSNAVDDVFMEKAKLYESMAISARNRRYLRLDYDGSGTVENVEKNRITPIQLRRI